MKKIKFLLLIVISLFIIPNVYAANDVKIESIDVLEKSESAEILTPATFEGLVVNVDIKFVNLHDYVKYKVVVSNTSDKDYRIKDNIDFDKSKYIHYEYSFDNNSNIVRKNSKKIMTIIISYDNLVPDSKLNADGSYSEPNRMVIDLARGNIINNPKTNSTILVLLIIVTLLVCSVSIVGIKRKNTVTTMLLLLGIVSLLPISILAIDEIQITINSKVMIEREIEFCVYDRGLTQEAFYGRQTDSMKNIASTPEYYEYMENAYRYRAKRKMIWADFKNSKYFAQVGHETPANQNVFESYGNESCLAGLYSDEYGAYLVLHLKNGTRKEVEPTDVILPCEEGIYQVKAE